MCRTTVLEVLDRAAHDPGFIAQLTDDGSKALNGYSLTSQECAALRSPHLPPPPNFRVLFA